jgi:outer membrane protein assembly factor BamB
VEIYPSRSRETVFTPGGQGYRLICYRLEQTASPAGKRRRSAGSQSKVLWEQRVPIRITAMIRAGDKIFVAGSPDVVAPGDPHGAWEGRLGGVLAAFAARDGEKLAEYKLAAPPVWDGMAAAGGRLYLATMDGQVLCFAGGKR